MPFDSRLPKTPLMVYITVHPQSLVVTASGGEGMGVREIERQLSQLGWLVLTAPQLRASPAPSASGPPITLG